MARKLFHRQCKTCSGTGGTDSGGFDPQGYPIYIGPDCSDCDGTGEVLDRSAVSVRIQGIQNTMNYAAPEVCAHLREQVAQLTAMLG